MSNIWKIITGIFAGIAAIVAFLGGLDPAILNYCKYVGIGCSPTVISSPITVAVSAGTPCNNDYQQICVEPSGQHRKLDTDIKHIKFVPTKKGGTYNENNIANVPNSNTGWYIDPKKDPVTPEKVCITVFARTGGCEFKFDM